MSLKHHDLEGMILPGVSIDEYKPKAGKEQDVIVLAFYAKDQDPAEDLNRFIQRGFVEILDSEVSPSTNEEGNYLVFVELKRQPEFMEKFYKLLKDIQNISGKLKWSVKTYLSDGVEFDYLDPNLASYISLEPGSYTTKEEFKMKNLNEQLHNFLKGSMVNGLTLENNCVRIHGNKYSIIAEVVDIGDYDLVIDRNFLSESAFDLSRKSTELIAVSNILGNYQCMPIDKYICVDSGQGIMLLKNTEIIYKD